MIRFNAIPVVLLTGVLAIGFLPSLATADTAKLPETNKKVLKFAQDNRGKQVGNGECWTLAADALEAAGVTKPGTKGTDPLDFGRKLKDDEKILSGDIVQFEGAEFVHKERNSTSTQYMAHHTAVVVSVAGKSITLLNQNVDGKKIVVATTINLKEKTAGTVDFYRPNSPEGEKKESEPDKQKVPSNKEKPKQKPTTKE